MPFLGTSGEVSAIGWRETGKGRRLVIGGNFYEEFSKAYTHLAEWDGDQWVSIGTSPDSAIQSIEWLDDGSGSALYVGGSFKHIGGIETSMIARYRNDAWEALGGGLNSTSGGSLGVRAIAAYSGIGDATLYAGGNFTYTGSFETGTMFTKFFAGFGVASPAEAAAPSKARGTQGDVVIESKVTGSVPLGLQWLRDGVPLVDMLGVSGATTSKLTLDDATARNGGVFELVAANSNGASISAPIKLEAGIVGDIDGNGLVNGADLAIVLGSWGTCAGCAADINGDGVADGADLAIVLGNWTG